MFLTILIVGLLAFLTIGFLGLFITLSAFSKVPSISYIPGPNSASLKAGNLGTFELN